MGKIVAPLVCVAVTVAGCAGPKLDLPTGAEAYARVPAVTTAAPTREFTIGPLDRLGVTVFGEPDLSTSQAQVDAVGNIDLPLAGRMVAAGKTTSELSSEIRRRLSKYLVDPQVSILVLDTVSQRVAVQGQVNQAGLYPIQGRTTLLEMLAMAKGVSNVADEQRVAVFRTIDNQRMGAMFDVGAITRGEAADPELRSGDVVVVGNSARRAAWRDFLVAAPALGLFVALGNAL